MLRLGHHHVIEQLGNPAVVPSLKAAGRHGHDRVGAAHALEVAFGTRDRRMRMQVRRMTVEVPEVLHVHRLGAVIERAVVAPRGEVLGQLRR